MDMQGKPIGVRKLDRDESKRWIRSCKGLKQRMIRTGEELAEHLAIGWDGGAPARLGWHDPIAKLAAELSMSKRRIYQLLHWGRARWHLNNQLTEQKKSALALSKTCEPAVHTTNPEQKQVPPPAPLPNLPERTMRPALALLDDPPTLARAVRDARQIAEQEAVDRAQRRGAAGNPAVKITSRHVRQAVEQYRPPPRRDPDDERREALEGIYRRIGVLLRDVESAGGLDAARRHLLDASSAVGKEIR